MGDTTLSRRGFLRAGGATAAGAAVLGVAGCGGGSGSGKTTLTWWDYLSGSAARALEQQLKRYEELHPGVSIQRRAVPFEQFKQTLLRGASAGELPDIVLIDNPDHQSFAELGILEDLTARVSTWGQADAYFDGPWRSTMWEGKNYGIPDASDCLTLWFNEEVLRSAGLDPPGNWDELNAAARELTDNDRYGFAVSAIKSEEGTFQWLPFLWQTGADLANIAGEGGQAALGLWVDMVQKGWMSQGILNWDQEAVKDEFANGKAAMMVNGPWQIPVLKEEAPNLKWNVVPLPKQEQEASILGGENRAIIKGSPNVDLAWDLLTWSQKPDVLKEYLTTAALLTSRQDIAEDTHWSGDPILSTFVEQLRVARPRAYGPKYPEMSSAIQVAIQAAVSGQSSVTDALNQTQQKITPLLPK
ncbi:MAG: extracellular solute-binding protein [Actinobacteria bacterium]|nr:extracellular solute-binding protein [Actinomycetota bacterium]